MEKELAEARSIQARLFPEDAPELPSFRITGLSEPCLAVGGDWYDYIPLASGRVGVVLGDVAGKGTGAALLMASTRSILRMYAERGGSPGAVLSDVNRVLVADLPSAKFVTMVYVVLDPASRKLTFASAGHVPPILVDVSGARAVKVTPELPLGIREGSYADHELEIKSGSRLFLYSDGVTEARDSTSEEYGEARLRRYAASPAASAQGLRDDILRFTKDYPVADDITIVVLEAIGQ
jgi:sigma-B regulation protein RsbU (phosphoserine phosphatase)